MGSRLVRAHIKLRIVIFSAAIFSDDCGRLSIDR